MYQNPKNKIGFKIRKFISDIYRDSDIGYSILRPFYKLYELGLRIMPDEFIIKRSFKKHMGYDLNLDNPKTLNEKINWLKLNNRRPIQTILADKYKVREYVKEKIGDKYLIPLLFETKNVKDIVPENLPEPNFIIKANHNSSGGLIVRDKTKVDWKKAQKRFKRLLRENHYYSTIEWQYKDIEPRIIVEQLLTHDDGSIPEDIKFHCFNGKVGFIMVDFDRFGELRTRNLYNSDWNLISSNWGRPNGRNMEKPSNLDEMIKVAEKLAEDFAYIRVDLYLVKSQIYFGELTFYHASGFQAFYKMESDRRFGDMLDISAIKNKSKK